jgi:hypothetical protein
MLTQLITVKARLGILDTDTATDFLLTNAIAAVSAWFDHECRRTLARTENFAQEFAGNATEICAACYPIEAVARVEMKAGEAEGWVEQGDVDFLVRRGCVISLASALGTWRAQGRVIYTGGYVLPGTVVGAGQTPLPTDLEQAAVEQVAYWFQNRERLGLARLWEYHGTYRQYAELDLLTSVRRVLVGYQRGG